MGELEAKVITKGGLTMGNKVWVQCTHCGQVHRVKSEDALLSDDDLYTKPIFCTRCRDGTKHILIGDHKEDVYWLGDVTLDRRYY